MSKKRLRMVAYTYIKAQISKFPGHARYPDLSVSIPLEDIRALKEGLADPSTELVASLKQLLTGASTSDEIDAYLVAPFRQRKLDEDSESSGRSHYLCPRVTISRKS